ncbi:MAG: hypothetical protein QOI36_5799, partial [Pseudonocardiales bacterium]|nr:hypothetical protein [Pseudonocardiales bacterium]
MSSAGNTPSTDAPASSQFEVVSISSCARRVVSTHCSQRSAV